MSAFSKLIVLATVSAVSFAMPVSAGSDASVSVSALKSVEQFTDSQFSGEPWELLGDTRGTYLPGYGVVFTFELSLVYVSPLTPFHLTATPQEIKSIHDRKIKQLAILREGMRSLLVKAASTLTGVAPAESIVIEAHLLGQPFEDHAGLPWRLTMTAQRQKLLDAVAHHATPADIAALIEERKE